MGVKIAKLPSLEIEASHFNSECVFHEGFTYILNLVCEALQYKLSPTLKAAGHLVRFRLSRPR